MAQFTSLKSRVVPLQANDIDTDQIIPARFLKTTDKIGMAEALFSDWRYNPDGSPRLDFILNKPEVHGAQILLAGDNFGCGSSREHAAWALAGYGFRAIISTSFADIFRNNALKNGLLPVVVDKDTQQDLFDLLEEVPDAELSIELSSQVLHLPDGKEITFPIDPFSKICLLKGMNELSYLMSFMDQIVAYEKRAADR